MSIIKEIEADARYITKSSKSNFLYSTLFLPREKSEALQVLYAFFRCSDDITDSNAYSTEERRALLSEWKGNLISAIEFKDSKSIILNRLAQVIQVFKIPVEHLIEFLKGMEMDLVLNYYETFSELKQYCYRVASTVGLTIVEVLGYKNPLVKKYAEHLGIALQLTNILRDIKEDMQNSRIYLPLEDLKKFGYTTDDLKRNIYNESFCSLMQYECNRINEYFDLAKSFLPKEDRKSMFMARIIEKIYRSVLYKIKKNNYNIFEYRANVSKFRKFYYALGVYVKYNLLIR
ncbi:MAG: phytoene/squalene synthase family protein [Ignavibacteria bacterium]